MSNKRGFTLIEILVVIIIIGMLAAIAVPSYTTMMEQGYAQAAATNLGIIYQAEKVYFLQNESYCISNGNPADCGSSLTNLNNNLKLNINDTVYSYACNANPNPNASTTNNFFCDAWMPGPNLTQIDLDPTQNPMIFCEMGSYCNSITQQ